MSHRYMMPRNVTEATMSKRLASVAETAQAYNFTEPSLRWIIYQAGSNGLQAAGAIIRIGRTVKIDQDRFEAWLESKTSTAGAA
jgi:hypothetical protein